MTFKALLREGIKYILGILLIAAVAGEIYAGAYIFRENAELKSKLSSIEAELASISSAIEESKLAGESAKKQIKELADKAAVPAKSQDEILTAVVSKAAPAVVSLVASKDTPLVEVEYVNPLGNDPMFRNLGLRIPEFRQVGTTTRRISAGTGFFIRSDGYILTNRHVVDETDADYTVFMSNGSKKSARVVYRDIGSDIAIVKVEGSGYPAIPITSASSPKLGQTVLAIGNALGEYDNSVSVGIISGLNRTIEAMDSRGKVETLSGIIQTDAAINRGNSGGPLLDLSGRALGVNVAMEQGASNIAFAIPASIIRPIIERILP